MHASRSRAVRAARQCSQYNAVATAAGLQSTRALAPAICGAVPRNKGNLSWPRELLSQRCLASVNVPPKGSEPSHFDSANAFDPPGSGKVPAAPYDASPLPGTAPSGKSGHLVVHPYSGSRPEWSWPTNISSVCPLLSELESRSKPGGSLQDFAISFSQGEARTRGNDDERTLFRNWDPTTSKFMRPVPNDPGEDELFVIYAYTPGRIARIGPLTLRTLDVSPVSPSDSPSPLPFRTRLERALERARIQTAKAHAEDETHVYVCTHGTRDCKCGVVGAQLVETLQNEVDRHEMAEIQAGEKPPKRVRVYSISHVGGHKWAANALVYPALDWYGNLRVTDAPLLLRAALAPASSAHDVSDLRERMVHWPRWRGRIGMDDAQQREHYAHWGPPLISTAQVVPRKRVASSPSSSKTASVEDPQPSFSSIAGAGDTVQLRFRSYEGKWYDVAANKGESIKDVAKRYDLPSIEATCGGQCECATCHAYLHAWPHNENAATSSIVEGPSEELVPPHSAEEDDMLEYAISRRDNSRLTCQISVDEGVERWMKQGGWIELPRF